MLKNNNAEMRTLNIMISILILIFLFMIFFLTIKLLSIDKAQKVTAEIKKQTLTTEIITFLQKKIGEKDVADLLVEENYGLLSKELKQFFKTNKCYLKIDGQKKLIECENPEDADIKTQINLPTYDKRIKQAYIEIQK